MADVNEKLEKLKNQRDNLKEKLAKVERDIEKLENKAYFEVIDKLGNPTPEELLGMVQDIIEKKKHD